MFDRGAGGRQSCSALHATPEDARIASAAGGLRNRRPLTDRRKSSQQSAHPPGSAPRPHPHADDRHRSRGGAGECVCATGVSPAVARLRTGGVATRWRASAPDLARRCVIPASARRCGTVRARNPLNSCCWRHRSSLCLVAVDPRHRCAYWSAASTRQPHPAHGPTGAGRNTAPAELGFVFAAALAPARDRGTRAAS